MFKTNKLKLAIACIRALNLLEKEIERVGRVEDMWPEDSKQLKDVRILLHKLIRSLTTDVNL